MGRKKGGGLLGTGRTFHILDSIKLSAHSSITFRPPHNCFCLASHEVDVHSCNDYISNWKVTLLNKLVIRKWHEEKAGTMSTPSSPTIARMKTWVSAPRWISLRSSGSPKCQQVQGDNHKSMRGPRVRYREAYRSRSGALATTEIPEANRFRWQPAFSDKMKVPDRLGSKEIRELLFIPPTPSSDIVTSWCRR